MTYYHIGSQFGLINTNGSCINDDVMSRVADLLSRHVLSFT